MRLDKQNEKDILITFHNIIEKTSFIDKLRSITGVIKDRFSEHDPRDTDKITYPCEYMFVVILLSGNVGYKTTADIWYV